jgi:hypothetical protein
MYKAKKSSESYSLKAMLLIALAAAMKTSEATTCDTWVESTGIVNNYVKAGRPFFPLQNSVFTSTNSSNPVLSATLYFSALGANASFIDLGCPPPLERAADGDTVLCIGSNVTDSEFTAAANNFTTALNSSFPFGKVAYGYADVVAGVGCAAQPIGPSAAVFMAEKSF